MADKKHDGAMPAGDFHDWSHNPPQRPTEQDLANILTFAEVNGVDPSDVVLLGGPHSDWLGTYERPKRGRKVRVSSRQFGGRARRGVL